MKDCNYKHEHRCANMPMIGDAAPEFGANTTNGYIDFPQNYRGRWVVLFSHPGDFTPVCTTEFMTFQSMVDEFSAIGAELVGLSVDSLASHLAWIQAIRDDVNFMGWKDVEITFPIIADNTGEIARKYGMIHDGASHTDTVRAVFIIDPRGIIRAMLFYPQSIGRNITEIKRILIALQTSDAFHVATPAEWIPGEDVIAPAPRTTADVNTRARGKNKRNWFLNCRSLSPEMIMSKIMKQKYITTDKKKTKKK